MWYQHFSWEITSRQEIWNGKLLSFWRVQWKGGVVNFYQSYTLVLQLFLRENWPYKQKKFYFVHINYDLFISFYGQPKRCFYLKKRKVCLFQKIKFQGFAALHYINNHLRFILPLITVFGVGKTLYLGNCTSKIIYTLCVKDTKKVYLA